MLRSRDITCMRSSWVQISVILLCWRAGHEMSMYASVLAYTCITKQLLSSKQNHITWSAYSYSSFTILINHNYIESFQLNVTIHHRSPMNIKLQCCIHYIHVYIIQYISTNYYQIQCTIQNIENYKLCVNKLLVNSLKSIITIMVFNYTVKPFIFVGGQILPFGK